MMRRLYARILSRVAVALLISTIVVMVGVFKLNYQFRRNLLAHFIPGHGLAWVRSDLDRTPPSDRAALLESMRDSFRFELRIVNKPRLSGAERFDTELGVVYLEDRFPPMVTLYLPLSQAGHYLAAGPVGPPPLPPTVVAIALFFATSLTLVAAALVVIPLARSIRRLRVGMQEIGGGALGVRIDARGDDLSELIESANGMARRLQQLFNEREEILQAVSHELGSPLARLRFRLEMVPAAVDPEHDETRSWLGSLEEEIVAIDQLSSDLVGWVEADSLELGAEAIAVAPVAERLVALLVQEGARHRDLEFVVQVHDEVVLTAEARHFRRALENLLRNAAQHATRRVVVEAWTGSEVTIEVRDDGPGIPAEDRLRVLEPFTRGASRPDPSHGMGLGLAIVKRVIERHGGWIRIETSREGGASVVTGWPRSDSGPRPGSSARGSL